MSVSSISSSYGYYQTSSHSQRKQELDALTQALQSGDLTGAQQAFSQIQQGAPSGGQSGGGNNAVVADISALGKALSANDLSSAQSAFSTLQEDIQNAPPPPPQSSGATDSSSDSAQSLFAQLADALQSGNLSSAQDAFSSLQDLTSAQSTQSSASDSNNPFRPDIQSLSDALSSGDISSAQTAFAQLQEDIQNAPPPPPPGGAQGGPGGPGGGSDKVQQAFSDLATALQSGNLAAAKTAFATLQSLAPDNQTASSSSSTFSSGSTSSTSSTTSTSSTDKVSTDLASLNDALQNGNLDSANSLFEALLADLQANAPQHPGMHHYQQNDATTATSNSVSVTA